LDPGGTALHGCDPDGATWLTAQRKRTPTGFLYPCPPAWPEFSGDGAWHHRGSVTLGYLGVWGDENNMDWRRFSNRDDSHYVRAVFGRAGRYRVQMFARSQPNITSGNARSIWNGVGSNHLTLKDGLVPAGSTSAQVAAVSAAQPERLLTVVREKQGIG